jgi:hypothetical protein
MAKISIKCGVRKEIRDRASKDGTTARCRSCKSKYDKALQPVVLPVDTRPQRCYTCNEMKPAADYRVDLKKSTGRSKICKLSAQDHAIFWLRYAICQADFWAICHVLSPFFGRYAICRQHICQKIESKLHSSLSQWR